MFYYTIKPPLVHETAQGSTMTNTYLNMNQLQAKLGNRSRSSLYRDVEENRLPKPLKIGTRLYWIESEVDAALNAQREVA